MERASAPAERRGQIVLVLGGLLGLVGFGAIVNGSFGPIDDLGVAVLGIVFLLTELVFVGLYVLVRRSPTSAPPPAAKA